MLTSEGFQQLALRFTDPVQHDYEVIRGILLTDETVAERSRITGVDRDTIREKARRFLQQGMTSGSPYGAMFWFMWKRLPGSYARLT
jgi:hypothetical protein